MTDTIQRPVRDVRDELLAATKAKEDAAKAGDFERAVELRDKERELQREWRQFTIDEVVDAIPADDAWRQTVGPCIRCGDRCPDHATLRRFTTPTGVVIDDPDRLKFLPPDPRRTGYVYVTHFYMCLALDEPVMVGICVKPQHAPEMTVTTTNEAAGHGDYAIRFEAAKLSWWQRMLKGVRRMAA